MVAGSWDLVGRISTTIRWPLTTKTQLPTTNEGHYD